MLLDLLNELFVSIDSFLLIFRFYL